MLPSTRYRADIDGLRAIAVTGVLLFHADNKLVSGGFSGVDVFFVISGYLITLILARENETDTFSLLAFYERRVRRLLPALFIVLATCLAAGTTLLMPEEARQLSLSALATLGFVSNVYFWSQSGYFAPLADTQPLLHTWSLAVEEQFYIVFPLILHVLQKRMGRYLGLVILTAVVLSFALCLWGTFHKPGATFYLAPFRAWELLLGAYLAVGQLRPVVNRLAMELSGMLGLMFILISFFGIDSRTPFPGIGAVPAVAGSAILIYVGTASGNRAIATKLLSTAPLVALGLISYPLYLWHWPALVFTRYYNGSHLDPTQTAVVIAGSLVLAAATYQLIEMSIRHRIVLDSRMALFAAAGLATATITTFTVFVVERDGLLLPMPAEARNLVLANQRKIHETGYPAGCLQNFMRPLPRAQDLTYCSIGHLAEKKVLFWGDSYVEQLYPVAQEAYARQGFAGRQVLFATSGGCQPIVGIERLDFGFHCNDFNRHVLERALMPDVETIVVGGAWNFLWGNLQIVPEPGEIDATKLQNARAIAEHAEKQLLSVLSSLTAARKNVVLILTFPVYPVSVPVYLARRILADHLPEILLTRELVLEQNARIDATLRRAGGNAGALLIDPKDLLCARGPCEYHEQMLSLYKDRSHLTPQGSLKLLPIIEQIADLPN